MEEINKILTLLGSTTVQNIILIATAGISLYIYKKNKADKLKNASIMIVSQVNSIEYIVQYIKTQYKNSYGILVDKPIYYSEELPSKEIWNSYRHLFINNISQTDYYLIDNFFETTDKIRRQQIRMKECVIDSFKAKSIGTYIMNYFQAFISDDVTRDIDFRKIRNMMSNLCIEPVLIGEYDVALQRYLTEYTPLRGTTAFKTLEELAAK